MSYPVYTFGPNAHPASALSLRDALTETFPTIRFDIEMVHTLTGLKEAVVMSTQPSTMLVSCKLDAFAKGFVAGFGGGVTVPTRQQAVRRAVTRADCPVAKRKSDPPPPSEPTLPSQPAPRVMLSRRPTFIGVAPPSRRV